MGIEIERKFLVDYEKWRRLEKPAGTHYRQGYILDDAKRTIRVRLAGDHGFITIKGISTGISRKEFEYEIPAKDATELIDNFAGSEVEKTRYRITYAGKLWEVDEFSGDNEGLLMAEIELKQEDEKFEKPDWINKEVSDDERFYNSNLSKNPFKNWGNDFYHHTDD
ncbi:MAG: adenylate cyclase [Mucilaginibacter sp.]|nr:adenylate cyclase [Mucilaginibacter sp.]